MSHLCNFTVRTFQCFLTEEVARTCTQLTTYDIFIQTVITVDAYVADAGLRTFGDTHFQVDRVTVNVYFHRIEAVEHISTIIVVVTDCIFIVRDTVVQQLLVIYITAFHAELFVQQVRRIYCVTYPGDVTKVIFLSFVDFHVDIYRLFIVRRYTVYYNLCVTVTQLVIFIDDFLFVFFVTFIDELLGTEKVNQLTFFVGLLHDTLQLLVSQDLVSVNGNLVDFDFSFLVNVHIYIYLLLVFWVFSFNDVYFRILETFFVKMLLDQNLGTVNQVRCNLSTFCHTQFSLQILTFTLLHTVNHDVGNTWTLCQLDRQVDFIIYNLIRSDFHVREQAMTPVSFYGRGDVISRYGDSLSDSQAGNTYQDIILIVLYSADLDVGDFIFFRCSVVKDNWLIALFSCIIVLCISPHWSRRKTCSNQ